MQWSVSRSQDSDLESLSAHYPNLRLITVPQVGSQEPQYDFKGVGNQPQRLLPIFLPLVTSLVAPIKFSGPSRIN